MFSENDIAFFLSIFKGLSLSDIIDLLSLARVRVLKPGDIYIQAGAPAHNLAYIKEGMIRAYHLKPNGDEITLMLRWENQFVASTDGIIYQQASRFIYQAIECTVLMEVDYKKAQLIIDNNPKLSVLRNSFLLGMLSQAMDRIEGFVLLSPIERYQKLIHEKPDIANRVHDKYLATLLGITPVSLSRIRKRVALQRNA